MALWRSSTAADAEVFVVSVEYPCVGDTEKLASTEDIQPAEKA